MRGLKRDLWKAGIAIAGMLLFLVLMAWIPASAANAEVRASGFAGPGTVQTTPTVDATVTALSKEQLTLQIKQLQNQLQNQNNWLANNSTALIAAVTALIVALFGIYQWAGNRRDARQKEIAAQDKELEDRKAERERREEEQKRWLKDQQAERDKRAEERFQAAVIGLGDEKEGARIGAAILLRTFLRPGYEEFYTQTFDLAVANLRLPRPRTPHQPNDPNTTLPLTTLRKALIVVFKESYPLARSEWIKNRRTIDSSFSHRVQGLSELNEFDPQSLDALGVKLDNAYLRGADLKQAWMPQAYLRHINLIRANLSNANLSFAKFSNAFLGFADLREANLREAVLREAVLRRADLHGADLRRANIGDAQSLKDANLRGVKGLTKEQLEACKAKGAIVDEDATTSSPQPTVATSPSSQSNDVQAQPAPPAQGSTPAPETSESSAP